MVDLLFRPPTHLTFEHCKVGMLQYNNVKRQEREKVGTLIGY